MKTTNCNQLKDCLSKVILNLNQPYRKVSDSHRADGPLRETYSQSRSDPSIKIRRNYVRVVKVDELTLEEAVKHLPPKLQQYVLFRHLTEDEKAETILQIHERMQAIYGESREGSYGGWGLAQTKRIVNWSHGHVSFAVKFAKMARKEKSNV